MAYRDVKGWFQSVGVVAMRGAVKDGIVSWEIQTWQTATAYLEGPVNDGYFLLYSQLKFSITGFSCPLTVGDVTTFIREWRESTYSTLCVQIQTTLRERGVKREWAIRMEGAVDTPGGRRGLAVV